MSRRPGKPRELLMLDHGTDYGPGHRQVRGQLQKLFGGAADVVIEERGDLDNPKAGRTVRGARRRDVSADLFARGRITQRHHDAVQRFLQDCCDAEGGSSGEFGMRGSGVPNTWPVEKQFKAAALRRVAWNAIGKQGRIVFNWVIFDNRALGAFEAHFGLREGVAGTRLRLTLTLLDEFYNPKASR